MLKKGDVSTEIDKGPFFFSLAVFLGSTAASVLLFALGGGDGLAIFAAVILLIVALAAFVVIFAMVTDCAYIEGDTLSMQYLFKKISVPVDEISKITYKEDLYTVYGKNGMQLGSINAKLTGAGRVISELDRKGVNFV